MTQPSLLRQQGISPWPFILLLVVVAALAAAGWWGWQQWQWLEQDREGQADRIAELRAGLDDERRSRERSLDRMNQDRDRLEAGLARDRQALSDVREGGQRLWLINEAESLASLAGQRLMLTGDAAASRRLLRAADETLGRLDDPEALPARKALAADLEALSGALQVDIEALVLRLGALQSLVPELAVPGKEAEEEEDTDPQAQSWGERLLSHLPVTVRRHEGEVPLPLTETQAATVRLTLDASLQQAQLALMQGRPEAYHQALDQARATLNQWFREDQARAGQLRAALDELSDADVDQALPEIGDGLAAVRELKRRELERGE